MPVTISQRLPQPLVLDQGPTLDGVEVAFELHGELRGDNVVLVLHDLDRSHRCTGGRTGPGSPTGWWRELVGSASAIDTDRFAVVCANLLGSPFGSTSPRTCAPGSSTPYGAAFPSITLGDQARALAAFVRTLGVTRLRAVIGPGLGGLAALELATHEPALVGAVAAICAANRYGPAARNRLGMIRAQLSSEEMQALDGPRRSATLTQLWRTALQDEYDAEHLARTYPNIAAREAALRAEAEAFAACMDFDCFASLAWTAASADVDLRKLRSRTLLIPASTDALFSPQRVREAYHLLVSAGVDAHFHELPSSVGHRAWELEPDALRAPLREFLAAG